MTKQLELEFWENSSGHIPVLEFIESLDEKQKVKTLRIMDLLEEKGTKLLQTNYMSKLSGYDLYELIVNIKGLYLRYFFVIKKNTCWFLHAFKKKSNHTPKKEIDIAMNRGQLLS